MLETEENPHPVMEVVRFTLNKSLLDQQLAALCSETETLLRAQSGFLARWLIRSETGLVTDLVLWRSRAEAEIAAATVTTDPAFAAYMAAIDLASVQMGPDRLIWSMQA